MAYRRFSWALALLFAPGLLMAQETRAEREAHLESRRMDREQREQRERLLRQWYFERSRLAASQPDAEAARQRAFLNRRTNARESLVRLANGLERLYALDPATATSDIRQAAAAAAREVDNVRSFVRWNVDRAVAMTDEPLPVHYVAGVEQLVELFQNLMPPMEVLMSGQTLDLGMHELSLTILGRMEVVLRNLAFDPR
jgi:hypothetical protein